jgi:hypothetical protein
MKYYRCSSYPTAYHGRVIAPDIFVWHSTHGGAKAWLDMLFSGRTTNGGNKITVHFAIYKDGDCVEYAPWKPGEAVACWHAGKSEWRGRTGANMFSLGCEIQHAPGEDFTAPQLAAIDELTRAVAAEYPTIEHTTHKAVSGRLQGKSDPYSPQWEAQAWPVVQRALTGAGEVDELMAAVDMILARLDAMQADIDASQRGDSFRGNIMLAMQLGDEQAVREEVARARALGIRLPDALVRRYASSPF